VSRNTWSAKYLAIEISTLRYVTAAWFSAQFNDALHLIYRLLLFSAKYGLSESEFMPLM